MAKSSIMLATIALFLISTNARGGGGGGRGGGGGGGGGGGRGGSSSSEEIGCCSGTTSKCDDASKTTCDRASTCEWVSGDDADCSTVAEPEPAAGCCLGDDSKCDTDDEAVCNKFAARKGCLWIAGQTDCSVGCCYGSNSKCDTDDAIACNGNMLIDAGCEWRAGADADCFIEEVPDTPGCCTGFSDTCIAHEAQTQDKCQGRSASGCEWREGVDSCAGCCVASDITDRDRQDNCDVANTNGVGDPNVCMTYISWNQCSWVPADYTRDGDSEYLCSQIADSPMDADGCCVAKDISDPNDTGCGDLGQTPCESGSSCEWVAKEEAMARYSDSSNVNSDGYCLNNGCCSWVAPGDVVTISGWPMECNAPARCSAIDDAGDDSDSDSDAPCTSWTGTNPCSDGFSCYWGECISCEEATAEYGHCPGNMCGGPTHSENCKDCMECSDSAVTCKPFAMVDDCVERECVVDEDCERNDVCYNDDCALPDRIEGSCAGTGDCGDLSFVDCRDAEDCDWADPEEGVMAALVASWQSSKALEMNGSVALLVAAAMLAVMVYAVYECTKAAKENAYQRLSFEEEC